MDDSVVMLALAIFIVSAPKEILLASDLQNKCIGVFTRCVRSSSIQVLTMNVVGLSLPMELSLKHLWRSGTKKGIFVSYENYSSSI